MSKDPNSAALAPVEVVRDLAPRHQETMQLGGGIADCQLSVQEVQRQIGAIKDLQKHVMKEGVHYGTIPGTDKPTLLLPGAQTLSFTFKLRASFAEERTDLHADGFLHREFFVKATITNARGEFLGLGMGSCSTMESKYRYRKRDNVEVTEHIVPDSYFRLKDRAAKARILAQVMDDVSNTYVAHKVAKGNWRIAKLLGEAEKIPYANPADYYNTVLKIAKKRAFVDAILTVTAASDTFTQDLEDITDNAERLTETTGEPYHEEAVTGESQSAGKITNAKEAAEAAKTAKEKKAAKESPPKTWGENVVHLGTLAGRRVDSLTVAELTKIKETWIDDAKRWTKASPQDKLLRIHVIQALGHYQDNPGDAPTTAPKAEAKEGEQQPATGQTVADGSGWDVVQAAGRIEEALAGLKLTEADWFLRLRSLNQIPDGKDWNALDDVDEPEWIKSQEATFAQLMKLWESRNRQQEAAQAQGDGQASVTVSEAPDDIPLGDESTTTKKKPTTKKK